MAGFAVDIGDEGAAYEKGVNMPSTASGAAAVEGIAAIGKGVFGVLDSMDAAKRAAQPTEAAVSREAFGRLSRSLDNLKGADPLKQRADLAGIVAEYNNAGFDIGEAEARLIKQRTGIDVDFLNFDPQQAAINATIEKLNNNPAPLYTARLKLEASGKPYTDNDVLAEAMAEVQTTEAAALFIANSKNIERGKFLTAYVPHAETLISAVRDSAIAGLEIEMAGGNLSPETIVNLRRSFDIVQAQIKKPALIEAEDFQGIQRQLDTLDNLLKSLESYDEDTLAAAKSDVINANSEVLLKLAKEGIDDPILSNALLSDKFDPTAYVAEHYTELRKALDGLSAEDIQYTDLDEYMKPEPVEGPDGAVTVPTPEIETLHDLEEIDAAEDRSPVSRKDAVFFAVSERINVVKPEMLDIPEHRDNFFAGVGQATVNIATSTRRFDQSTMALVYNDDTYLRLKRVRQLDPEKADLAEARLIDGLKAQFNIVSTALSGSMQSSYFKVTGLGKIEYDLEKRVDTGQIRMDRAVLPLVKTAASKYYNNDVTAMLADRGRRVAIFDKSQIENAGFKFDTAFRDYREVQKKSKPLQFYVTQMKKLGVDTASIEQVLIRPVDAAEPVGDLGTRTNPFQIYWSDDTDTDEKLFAGLDDGAYFTGPDGQVYVKGMD
jgi:hypothetical protein